MEKILNHLKKMDWVMIGCVIFLTLIGLVMNYSSSFFRDDFLNFEKQAIFLLVGFGIVVLLSFFDWRRLKDNSYLILFLYFLNILILTSLLLFAPETRGARGWFHIGILSIDPVEPMKIILLILLAKYFSKRHIEIYNIKHILVSAFYVFIPCLLIILQPDMGSAIILLFLWLGILIVSEIKIKHFLILSLVFIIIFVFSWTRFLKPYQRQRIMSFFFPQTEPLSAGWSQAQSKIAIGSGGLLGKGFRKGSQVQLGFLTLPQTDFVFSAISEEFGFLGVAVLSCLVFILFLRIMRIAFQFKGNFPRLFAVGFSILIVTQTFIHTGMNLGILPVIGVAFPFVSYGGSGLLCNFIGIGILQSFKVSEQK